MRRGGVVVVVTRRGALALAYWRMEAVDEVLSDLPRGEELGARRLRGCLLDTTLQCGRRVTGSFTFFYRWGS